MRRIRHHTARAALTPQLVHLAPGLGVAMSIAVISVNLHEPYFLQTRCCEVIEGFRRNLPPFS